MAATDIEVYKDGSVTQRASDNGYTLLDTDGIDFDGLTGIHGFSINLSDNSTAGFWAAGSRYFVVVSSVTIDSQTVSFVAATFEIGVQGAVLDTTIATLSSQTSFTLTNGPAEDDALNGCVCYIHDVASAVQGGYAVVSDYTGSTKTVTLTAGTTFTAAATDNISFFPPGNTRWYASVDQAGGPDVSDLHSLLTLVRSDTTRIESDTNTLASDLAEGDFSDILSRLTVTNSQLLIVKSDTSDIKSHLVVIAAVTSDIQSDTNVMVPIVSDIQSDTNVLVTKMRGVVIATGTIGATGNSTTAIHLPDAVFDSLSDDELNGYLLVLYDNSNDEYHTRTILDWTNTGDLATVATLPFTPEASVDLYWVLPPQSAQTPELDGDISDVLSRLTVTNSQLLIVKSDTSDIKSALVIVASDTAVIESVTSDIQSDTNKLVSDATEVDTSDIQSLLTKVYSDTTAIEGAGGALTAAQDSKLTEINSQVVRIHSDTITLASDLAEADFSDIQSRLTLVLSDTSDILSRLIVVHSETTAIQSDTTTLASDLAEADFSDIHSLATKIYSDTTAIEAGGGALTAAQDSKLTEINSQVVRIHSDTISLASDLAEADFSDIHSLATKIYSDTTAIEGQVGGGEGDISDVLSRLTVTNSQLLIVKSDTSDIRSNLAALVAEGDFSDILSRLTVTNSQLLIVKSDTSDIKSALVIIASDTARIESDTNTLASDLAEADFSDIHSLVTKVYSDTAAIHGQTTTIASDTAHIESDAVRIESMATVIKSDTSDVLSRLTAIVGEGDFSDILSRLTVTNSQLLVVKSDTSDIASALVKIYSDTALATTAAGEPGQGDPPVSASPQDKLAYLYKAFRNKVEQTSSEFRLFADDASTVDQKAAVSDDGTTFTRGEVGTGA